MRRTYSDHPGARQGDESSSRAGDNRCMNAVAICDNSKYLFQYFERVNTYDHARSEVFGEANRCEIRISSSCADGMVRTHSKTKFGTWSHLEWRAKMGNKVPVVAHARITNTDAIRRGR